jgi:chromosomal replication initiation ATPase DnaA
VQLDGRYRFDNFVVGAANRSAAAAARAVAQGPTAGPLVIYGGSGLGKTHLLGAIGNTAAELQPGVRIAAATLDEFVRQLHAAASVDDVESFRQRYDEVDLLLIDDIQFLMGRRETQSELLRLCDCLPGAGRQIVFTSDRPPTELSDVDQRLLTRLGGGLVVDLGPPDRETRAAMLAAWCQERGVQSGPGAIEALAGLDIRTVRDLQGALTRVVSRQGLASGGRIIEVEDIRQAFADRPKRQNGAAPAPVSEASRPAGSSGEYLAFLSDFAHAVAQHVGDAGSVVDSSVARSVSGPSPDLTRQTFDVGSSNELAVRAADAVISDPGKRFNPLFIHGPAGVGKTHLINAIGNSLGAIGHRRPAVAYVGAPALVDELIGALRAGQVDRWRTTYRSVNALLIDDVHLMQGEERTQDELLQVINDLHAAGKQIVFTSDRPPRALSELEPRLRSRLAGGLVVEIQPPDRELREALFARYLRSTSADQDTALARYLAAMPVTSADEIRGVVTRLTTAADKAGVQLGLDLARSEIEGANGAPLAPPSTSAVGADVDPYFLDGERVVWEWPEVVGRVIEEWR